MTSILITGCSSGFGRLAAQTLAGRGDRVWATMRDVEGRNREAAEALRQQSKEKGWRLDVLDLDVTSDASVDSAAEAVRAEGAGPDVVLNNAGRMYAGVTEAYTAEEFLRQLDVNVLGIHRVTRAFLPSMRARGSGLFINLSSIAGRMALPFFGLYHASKWGVEGYSLGMRRELACTGIDVVVVEPGPFTTQLFPNIVGPADGDGRGDGYPQVSHDTFAAMAKAFDDLFANPETPTDPGDVVERIVALIDMEPGARPFRTVVGVDFGVAARNASAEAHEPPFLQALGLDGFATLRASLETGVVST